MPSRVPAHVLDPFLAAADTAAAERPEVDPEVAADEGRFHDPDLVRGAYLVAISTLRL